MSKEAMYKLIPIEEWNATETVDEVTIYTCADRIKHPNARMSDTEVVISCNDGSGTMTQEEMLAHIEANWPKEEATL